MKTNLIKFFAVAVFSVAMFAVVAIKPDTVVIGSVEDDVAASYKKQCAMCHTPTASKAFDLAKTDEHHVEAILKGVKAEKPPNMPGFEAKGMTADQAKALVAHMRQLRTPPPAE